MASYTIRWKESAIKELRGLPRPIISRIVPLVDALAENPFPAGVVKLAGADRTYRVRVGDYRVIYTVESQVLLIEVVRVRHRRDAYR